jgi:hypothetical protein
VTNVGDNEDAAADGDDPSALQDSAAEFSIGVTTDGSISLGVDGELKTRSPRKCA